MNGPLVSYLKTLVVVVLVTGLFILALQILVAVIPVLIGIGVVVAIGYIIYLFAKGSYAEHKHYLVHEKPFDDAIVEIHKLNIKNARVELKTAWADLKQSWAEFRGKKVTP